MATTALWLQMLGLWFLHLRLLLKKQEFKQL
jgi:hypothetical protein